MIQLSCPEIDENDIKSVVSVLRSGKLANGMLADRFAAKVADIAKAKYGLAVSSGTVGLELCLRNAIEPGERVAVPAYTFVASANAILAAGGVPFFVDVDEEGLMTLDEAKRAVSAGVKVAVVVDLFGRMADKAGKYLRKQGVYVVQDACESIGRARLYGDVAVFGFYPNKQITTGEGGVIVTDDRKTHETLCRMKNHGRAHSDSFPRSWGTNARMSEIHAALGLSQIERLPEILKKRKQVAEWYRNVLPRGIRVLRDRNRSWFVYMVWFKTREEAAFYKHAFAKMNIPTGDYFPYVPACPQFRAEASSIEHYPMAAKLSQTGFAIPFHGQMTLQSVSIVCRVFHNAKNWEKDSI